MTKESDEYNAFYAGYVAASQDRHFDDLDIAQAYEKWVSGD